MSEEQFLVEQIKFSESVRATVYLVLFSWGGINYLKRHFLALSYDCL